MRERPYYKVFVGDGSWYYTQDPPSIVMQVVGFVCIVALMIWPLTLCFMVLTVILMVGI